MRHALWSATIAREFGSDIMQQVGNSHEPTSLLNEVNAVLDSGSFTFSDMELADTAADILNNQIGIDIAANKAFGEAEGNMKGITGEVLKHYYYSGLYVVEGQNEAYTVVLQKLTIKEYIDACNRIDALDNFGHSCEKR